MTLLGITGTMGAGKGTLVSYLVEKKGFAHYSARAFLIAEIEKRGLPVDRESMIVVSNDLRATHSPSYIIETLFAQARERGQNAVLESVLTVGEAEFLKKEGVVLIAIDADRKVRYERICARGSETDYVSYETFVAQEERKMHSDDPAKHNVAGVMEMADIHLTNNGTVAELEQTIEKMLEERGVL